MWYTHRKTIIVTILLTLVPMLVGIYLWDSLPDVLATHFDANGTPNGWASKTFTVFGMPILMAALEVVCVFVTSADPRARNISNKALLVAFWVIPVTSWFVAATIYAKALGLSFNIGGFACLFIGVLFLVLGNFMPKNKNNYTLGIRTPWALNDNENWQATQRLGGLCFTIGGGLILVVSALSFFSKSDNVGIFALYLLIAVAALAGLVPAAYSYLLYRRKQQNKGTHL